MKLNYAIICYKQLDDDNIHVMHSCLYENEPQEIDIDSLQQELYTDKEFGMIGDVEGVDYEMIMIKKTNPMWEELELPNEINED